MRILNASDKYGLSNELELRNAPTMNAPSLKSSFLQLRKLTAVKRRSTPLFPPTMTVEFTKSAEQHRVTPPPPSTTDAHEVPFAVLTSAPPSPFHTLVRQYLPLYLSCRTSSETRRVVELVLRQTLMLGGLAHCRDGIFVPVPTGTARRCVIQALEAEKSVFKKLAAVTGKSTTVEGVPTVLTIQKSFSRGPLHFRQEDLMPLRRHPICDLAIPVASPTIPESLPPLPSDDCSSQKVMPPPPSRYELENLQSTFSTEESKNIAMNPLELLSAVATAETI